MTMIIAMSIITSAVPAAARRDGHPARRVVQALRIAVNGELDCLSSALDTAFDCLNVGSTIKSLEKDFTVAAEKLSNAQVLLFSYPVYTFVSLPMTSILPSLRSPSLPCSTKRLFLNKGRVEILNLE